MKVSTDYEGQSFLPMSRNVRTLRGTERDIRSTKRVLKRMTTRSLRHTPVVIEGEQ